MRLSCLAPLDNRRAVVEGQAERRDTLVLVGLSRLLVLCGAILFRTSGCGVNFQLRADERAERAAFGFLQIKPKNAFGFVTRLLLIKDPSVGAVS